jgi:membrane-associated phospholipid phosphatase
VFSRYRDVRFRLVDLLSLGYMGAFGVLTLVFHRNVHAPVPNAIIHFTFVAVGLESVRAAERNPDSTWIAVVRTFYPAFFFAYGYAEVDDLQTMLFGSNWASSYLASADLRLFGVHPTVWVERWYGSPLDEVLSLCYLSYYVIGLLITVPWFVRGRREQVFALGAIVGTTYVINYSLFYLMPAEGPRFLGALGDTHGPHVQGEIFAPLLRRLLGDAGVVKGGCFPSSHVAGAIAYALCCARYGGRRMTTLIGFFATGIVGATVYLGYHHAVDPLAGIVVGLLSYKLGVHLLQRRGEDPYAPEVEPDESSGPPLVPATES